jgi:hypothetical protein
MELITKLDDERLPEYDDVTGLKPLSRDAQQMVWDSLRAVLEWKQGAETCIIGPLENRIKEIENQFTEYAHDSQIKRDALTAERDAELSRLRGIAENEKGLLDIIKRDEAKIALLDKVASAARRHEKSCAVMGGDDCYPSIRDLRQALTALDGAG